MFRLLQRMDDSTPRHAEGGGKAPLHLLRPVTVLADADQTEGEALEDWARGLDWVHWLFSSVRHRLQALYFEGDLDRAESRIRELGAHLIAAWRAAEAGDAAELQRLDQALATAWPANLKERSIQAGELLLRGTKGARYQGVLGRFRTACDEGRTPGHFLTVWAAVGHFFQLSAANVVAEYLRLELRMAGASSTAEEAAKTAVWTSRLLKEAGPDLQLMGQTRMEPETRSAATPS